jgi:hypothetical protein
MVQTRSQKTAAANGTVHTVAEAPPTPTEKKKTTKKKTIYRGFVISAKKHQCDVDRFYERLDQQLTAKNVLMAFWLNTPPITLPEIPIEALQQMLVNLIDNEAMWQRLDKTILQCVVPHEPFLMQPDIQLQIRDGQVQFSYKLNNRSTAQVDLTPLKEFSFWIRLIQKLFCSIQSSLLQKCEQSDTKLERALLARDIYRFSVSCRRMIDHNYAFGLRFYATQIHKLVEFFNEGLEFVLYAFGIFHPEMVSDNYYPFLKQSSENLYGVPELAIDDDDPVFGEAKMMFQRFY